jgi:hypothetical protein
VCEPPSARVTHTALRAPASSQAGGLLFLATTRRNVAPSVVLELLSRIAAVLKDYCGVLNEETLRKNFILAYELLDEMIDFGCDRGGLAASSLTLA